MTIHFGRNANLANQATRYGRRSIVYGVTAVAVAFVSLVGMGIAVTDLHEPWQIMASMTVGIIALLVALVFHIAGAYLGWRGLRSGTDSPAASAIGILFNLGLLATDAYLLWPAAASASPA